MDGVSNQGLGICRTPITQQPQQGQQEDSNELLDADGKTWIVFVPYAIPGELVKAKVFRNYNSYSEADLIEVLEPSPHRIDPVCPLAGICGGCQYQHMSIESQRDLKTMHVQDVFERIAGLPITRNKHENDGHGLIVRPTVGTDQIWNYRSKITPHYEAPVKNPDGNSYRITEIGFKKKSSRRIVDVPYCHIATEAINSRLTDLRMEKRDEAASGTLRSVKKGATLLLRDANEGVVTDNNQYVTTNVSGLTFRFKAGNFFQNNPFMLPVLVEHVVEAATQVTSDGKQMTHLIDCYCGSGLFGLATAPYFQQCVGIEVNENAIEEARINAQINGIQNCAFVAATAEAIFNTETSIQNSNVLVQNFPRETTAVVLDPPRKGCSEEFLEQLYIYGPQRVVYMSCDPATQARDSKGMVAAGYSITSIQPFDLFPQTRHIECLIVLERDK